MHRCFVSKSYRLYASFSYLIRTPSGSFPFVIICATTSHWSMGTPSSQCFHTVFSASSSTRESFFYASTSSSMPR